jgi:hypothetical protein
MSRYGAYGYYETPTGERVYVPIATRAARESDPMTAEKYAAWVNRSASTPWDPGSIFPVTGWTTSQVQALSAILLVVGLGLGIAFARSGRRSTARDAVATEPEEESDE